MGQASGAISWASLTPAVKLQKAETVLVLGAGGGLGVIAVQIAKAERRWWVIRRRLRS